MNKTESLHKMSVYAERSVNPTETQYTDYFIFTKTYAHSAHCVNYDVTDKKQVNRHVLGG